VKKIVMTWEKVIEEVELYLSEICEEMLSISFNQIDAIIEEEEEEERRGYIPIPETIQKEERKMIKRLVFSEKQIILDMEGDVTASNSVLKSRHHSIFSGRLGLFTPTTGHMFDT
jgi:GTPase involved in cell partitioning and DNA repair